jgi:hypothetical protein
MIKYDVVTEDIHFTMEAIGDGNYKLIAEDSGEGEKGEKVINSREAAAILFSSFDEFTDSDDSLEDVQTVAQNAVKGFPVSLIP